MSRELSFSMLLVLAVSFSSAAGKTPTAETPTQLSKIAGWKGTAPGSADAFTFVVASDRHGGAVPGKWAAAVRQVNLLGPHFVMSVGDLISGYTEDVPEINRQWEEFDALTRKFQSPFFYCPGNHDITNNVMWEIYRKRHGVNGKTYYSFNYRGCHFIVLDSTTSQKVETFRTEQLAWLEKDIAAAKDAKHVFLFLHHPSWSIVETWPHIAAILPKSKTTVFAGHWHSLRFRDIEGIPFYVLSATASGEADPRYEGKFRMFAHVAVSDGKPTIALIPLDEILPAKYAQFVTDVKKLAAVGNLNRAIPATGGSFSFEQKNAFAAPVKGSLKWEAPGWKISPDSAQFTIAPRKTTEQQFHLTPLSPTPPKPKLSVTYKFPNPFSGEEAESVRQASLGTFAQLAIPRLEGIQVDGDSSDFSGVAPLRVADSTRIWRGLEDWSGPEDSSFELRVASDGKRLFVAVNAMDDQIHNDETNWAHLNDAVEFFWDSRSGEKLDGRHGEGTGHLILVVPDRGGNPKPQWFTGNRAAPKGIEAACRRRKGGYVYEFSVPLDELGIKTLPAAGGKFRMEIQLDDRDRSGEKATRTHMTTSGLGGNYQFTGSYARCRFE